MSHKNTHYAMIQENKDFDILVLSFFEKSIFKKDCVLLFTNILFLLTRHKPIRPAWEEKRRSQRTTEIGLQTEEPGLTYRFQHSPGFMDPASIASYVISPDSLNGVYQPQVFQTQSCQESNTTTTVLIHE